MSEKNKKHIPYSEDLLAKKADKELKVDFKVSPFEKYQHKFSTSLGTLFLGLILVIIGFILLGYSEGAVRESNHVKSLPLIEIENLRRTEGTVKITGYPIPACEITIEACAENLIYLRKIREEERDGVYVPVRYDESWANFRIGDIEIMPQSAEVFFNLRELSVEEFVETRNGEQIKYRETIKGVTDQEKLIVVGFLKNKTIEQGMYFILTNKTNNELVNYLREGTTFNWWVFKISAFLLLTLGIAAFILPVLVFLDVFPKIGLGLISVFFLLSALIAFIFVFLSTIVLAYWWLVFVAAGGAIIMLIRIKSKKDEKRINIIP